MRSSDFKEPLETDTVADVIMNSGSESWWGWSHEALDALLWYALQSAPTWYSQADIRYCGRQQISLKRQVLEEMCSSLFSSASDRLEALQRFVDANPVVENYARFRATCEKLGIPWQSWPQPLREGRLNDSDYDEWNESQDIRQIYLPKWREIIFEP